MDIMVQIYLRVLIIFILMDISELNLINNKIKSFYFFYYLYKL